MGNLSIERIKGQVNAVVRAYNAEASMPDCISQVSLFGSYADGRANDRSDVDLPEGAFFLADIYGLEVRDAATGEVLGKIADVLTLPANNVYVVKGGPRELMIPAVPQFIAETNVEGGYLRVNLMEGL